MTCVRCCVMLTLLAGQTGPLGSARLTTPELGKAQFTILPLPVIQTVPQHYRVERGGTAILECDIGNLGEMVKIWKNGTRVIYVGDIKIRNDPRISLNQNSIYIKGVDIWDSGWYSCEVENDIDHPIILKHNLQVLDPPQFVDFGTEQMLTSISGSTISLSCRADGQPSPNITWTKEDRRTEILGYGPELTLTNIGRLDHGRYKCSANNGVGNPVSKTVNLSVLYAPEIFPVKKKVHGKVGISVTVSCDIWSNPPSQVNWGKAGVNINTKPQNIQSESGSLLSSINVFLSNETYLGNYSCTAQNRFGAASDTVLVRGNPDVPEILSKVLSDGQSFYTLVWKSAPEQNVSMYKIMYRKLPDGSVVYAWDIVDYPVTTPYTEESHSYVIQDLEADSAYTINLKAENSYGWSDSLEDFLFFTRGKETRPQDSPVLVTDTAGTAANCQRYLLIYSILVLLYSLYLVN